MKIINKLILITIASIGIFQLAMADEIANPNYPYNASDAVTMFDRFYQDKYDTINDDLHANTNAAKENWSQDAMLAKFTITVADDIENGYSFEFTDENNPEKIYVATPTMDKENTWSLLERDNTENLDMPVSNVHLVLRKLIPAIQKDPRLLPALDRSIGETKNTKLLITIKKNDMGESTWYMDFRITGKDGVEKKYQAWVSAVNATKPEFKVIRKQ